MRSHPLRFGFTLLELLIVCAIIAVLIGILVPSLSAARNQAKTSRCLAQLRVLGHGLVMYTSEHRDVLIPGRLPAVDDCNWYAPIAGGRKYRPTFLAMMSVNVGAPPFDDPKECRNQVDRHGEPGDRQNYSYAAYVCPSVPDWTDERNGSYGYNYQFIGNSRLSDFSNMSSFKNWPVSITRIRYPGRTVAVADCMGTAASVPRLARQPYDNNARDADRLGNEGFNLDPPLVDPADGEMCTPPDHRSAADPRHSGGRANALWVDGHADSNTLQKLGYRVDGDGVVLLDGDNTLWSGNGTDEAWTPEFRH